MGWEMKWQHPGAGAGRRAGGRWEKAPYVVGVASCRGSEQRAWKATKKMGSERGGGLPPVKSRQHGPRAARIRDRFFFLLLLVLLLLLLLNRHA